MSGLEVGFGVLGILPLIVSALEHYNDCFRPFHRYRKFAIEVDRFQTQLKIQKTIFRNQCRILLGNVKVQDAAASMLRERSHPSWADSETEQQLAEHLQDSKEACIATVELIDERLKHVENESLGFRAVIDDVEGVGGYSILS